MLFEFVQRFCNTEWLGIEDQAEEVALWNLAARLEEKARRATSARLPSASGIKHGLDFATANLEAVDDVWCGSRTSVVGRPKAGAQFGA